jgi:hypothetical protein
VKIFQGTGQLIYDIFLVHEVQHPVFDCFEDIAFHELEHKVYVIAVFGRKGILQSNHICMLDMGEQTYFSVYTLSIDFVLKGHKDFFDGEYLSGLSAAYFPNVSVCSAADLGDDLEALLDVIV